MSATREEIHRAIDRWPGIHFNELVRRLDLAPGQVQHHVTRLHRDGKIVREPLFGRTHFYLPAVEADERQAIALLRRETPRAIVSRLLEDGPTYPRLIASELDLADSTVSYHANRLMEAGLVDSVTSPTDSVRLEVVDPDVVGAALSQISPDPSARLADRLERLIDDILEE